MGEKVEIAFSLLLFALFLLYSHKQLELFWLTSELMMAYTITLVSPFSKFKTRAGMFWGPCFSFFPRTAWSATGTLHLCKMGHTCMGPNCLTKCWWSVAWPVLNPYSLPKQAEGPRGLRPAAWPRQALLSVGTLAWAPVGSSESDLDISLFLVHVLAFHDLGKLTSLVFQIDHSHSFLCPKVFSIEVPLFFQSPTQILCLLHRISKLASLNFPHPDSFHHFLIICLKLGLEQFIHKTKFIRL